MPNKSLAFMPPNARVQIKFEVGFLTFLHLHLYAAMKWSISAFISTTKWNLGKNLVKNLGKKSSIGFARIVLTSGVLNSRETFLWSLSSWLAKVILTKKISTANNPMLGGGANFKKHFFDPSTSGVIYHNVSGGKL